MAAAAGRARKNRRQRNLRSVAHVSKMPAHPFANTVYFENDSAEINQIKGNAKVLDGMAKIMADKIHGGQFDFTVYGAASMPGGQKHNEELSGKRAVALRGALLKKLKAYNVSDEDIKKLDIKTDAQGPVDDADTEAGNRRAGIEGISELGSAAEPNKVTKAKKETPKAEAGGTPNSVEKSKKVKTIHYGSEREASAEPQPFAAPAPLDLNRVAAQTPPLKAGNPNAIVLADAADANSTIKNKKAAFSFMKPS